jgi:hypothetical protein
MITKERTFWLLKPESVPSKIGRSVICNKFTGFEQFCSAKDVGSGDGEGVGVGVGEGVGGGAATATQ